MFRFSSKRLLLSALLALGLGCDNEVTCPTGSAFSEGACRFPDGAVAEPDSGPGEDEDAFVPCEPTGEVDVPDGEFVDADCDGFDGDLARAVAVVPEGSTAPSGVAAEASTLTDALATARTEGLDQVWVPVGTHEGPVELIGGISVYGGYDAEAGWSRTRSEPTVVSGPGPVLVAEDIGTATRVALMTFEADDAAAEQSSIAGRIENSASVVLEDVQLKAGRGGAGVDATQPERASSGLEGNDGAATGRGSQCPNPTDARPASPIGGAPICGPTYGGRGGRVAGGGDTFVGSPESGEDGCNAAAPGVVCARIGGNENGGSAPGGDGTVGATGAVGEAGTGAEMGTFAMGGYVASVGTAGSEGGSGQGGGGGGAARDVVQSGNDFCIYFGASGGSGGSGGCGGEGGPAGTSGGASVALWLWESSVTLIDVSLVSAGGGAGGRGAEGGEGGAGGGGGSGGAAGGGLSFPSPTQTIGAGGDGGPGGEGGEGGAGGGGAGGPSVGILLGGESAETEDSTGVTFLVGPGGTAGRGGAVENDGAAGESFERLDPEA